MNLGRLSNYLPPLILKFIQTYLNLMRIFTHANTMRRIILISVYTPESGPAETGLTGPMATALRYHSSSIFNN